MSLKENDFAVLWQATCNREHQTFLIIDDDSDPDIQCPACHAEMDVHNITETDKAEQSCVHCKGQGRVVRSFMPSPHRITNITDRMCIHCDGTGIQKFDHTKVIVGRLYGKDLIELAKFDPQGWR